MQGVPQLWRLVGQQPSGDPGICCRKHFVVGVAGQCNTLQKNGYAELNLLQGGSEAYEVQLAGCGSNFDPTTRPSRHKPGVAS